MARKEAEFEYTNEDGDKGRIEVRWGPWEHIDNFPRDAPIMVTFDDASWMGVDDAERFSRWLSETLVKARND